LRRDSLFESQILPAEQVSGDRAPFDQKAYYTITSKTSERLKDLIKNSRKTLLTIAVSLMLGALLVQQATAQSTQISVIPVDLEVGPSPPTDPFTINITLTDFTGVYTWQTRLNYNPALLNVTGASYPSDHIFAGKTTSPVSPVIDNAVGYVLFGNSLVGDEPGINGTNVVLCQIEMRGVGAGVGNLTFHTGVGGTFLLDADGDDIAFTANSGEVTVVPELSSVLLAVFFLVTALAAVIGKTYYDKYTKRCG